jgi:hypothetical protein
MTKGLLYTVYFFVATDSSKDGKPNAQFYFTSYITSAETKTGANLMQK